MKEKLRVHVEHIFQPDPEAVRRAIEALIRLSDEARARRQAQQPREPEEPREPHPEEAS